MLSVFKKWVQISFPFIYLFFLLPMARTHRNFLATAKLQTSGTSWFHKSSIGSLIKIKPLPRHKSWNKNKRNRNHQKQNKIYYLSKSSFALIYCIKSKKENKLYATSNDCLGKERATGDSIVMLHFSFFLFFLSQCSKSYQRLMLEQSQKCAVFPFSINHSYPRWSKRTL